jgi:hypothetical protein
VIWSCFAAASMVLLLQAMWVLAGIWGHELIFSTHPSSKCVMAEHWFNFKISWDSITRNWKFYIYPDSHATMMFLFKVVLRVVTIGLLSAILSASSFSYYQVAFIWHILRAIYV